MKVKYWNSNKIVSSSAILISLMTLFILVYQTKIIQQEQRMSVLPYLSLSNYNTGTPNYKYVLKNDGIGPAFIEKVEITYDGKTYDSDLSIFLEKNFPEMKDIDSVFHSNISPGRLIPAGEAISIFEVHNSLSSSKRLYELLHRHNIGIKITYKSAYNEKWFITKKTDFPKKIL